MTRASHRQNYVIPPRRNGRSRWSNSLRDRTRLRPIDQQSQPGLLRRKTLARSPNSQFRLRLGDETYAPHQSARLYAAAITLDREPLGLPSTRKSYEDSSAGMRSETATRRRPAEATAIEETTEERSRSSSGVWWAWLDLNQRPHPYQLNAANRCAAPFPQVARDRRGQR